MKEKNDTDLKKKKKEIKMLGNPWNNLAGDTDIKLE